MKELSKAADEIAEKLKEQGYEYFNIKYGVTGTDFKTVLTEYLDRARMTNVTPVFPIYAGSGVAATSPDHPYSLATFRIVDDASKGLRIDAMGISMYECQHGALRTSLELTVNSLEDIPSRQNAAKMIEEKGKKWYNPVTVPPKRRKENYKWRIFYGIKSAVV